MRWHFSARLYPHKGSFEALSSLFHSAILHWTPFITSNSYALLNEFFLNLNLNWLLARVYFHCESPVKAKREAGNLQLCLTN